MNIYRTLYFGILNLLLYLFYYKQIYYFKNKVGYYPSIALPLKYHEKMLWRKIFDHNPLFVTCCDKLATKGYAKNLTPEIRIPETLWSGLNIRQAPDYLFEKNTIIKSNHATDQNYFFNKYSSDLAVIHQMTSEWLNKTHGEKFYESAYFKVERTLFIEELIPLTGKEQLLDIGIRCVNGKPILASVIIDNKTDQMRYCYFDLDGNRLFADVTNLTQEVQHVTNLFPLQLYFEAIQFASKLSEEVDYARFDFMTNGRDLYLGEITVYPTAGLSKATPEGKVGYDTIINSLWDLRKSWFLSNQQSGWKRYYAKLLDKFLTESRTIS